MCIRARAQARSSWLRWQVAYHVRTYILSIHASPMADAAVIMRMSHAAQVMRLNMQIAMWRRIFDVDLAMELAMPTLQKSFIKYLEHPDPGVVTPDRQAFLSIWRV